MPISTVGSFFTSNGATLSSAWRPRDNSGRMIKPNATTNNARPSASFT